MGTRLNECAIGQHQNFISGFYIGKAVRYQNAQAILCKAAHVFEKLVF